MHGAPQECRRKDQDISSECWGDGGGQVSGDTTCAFSSTRCTHTLPRLRFCQEQSADVSQDSELAPLQSCTGPQASHPNSSPTFLPSRRPEPQTPSSQPRPYLLQCRSLPIPVLSTALGDRVFTLKALSISNQPLSPPFLLNCQCPQSPVLSSAVGDRIFTLEPPQLLKQPSPDLTPSMPTTVRQPMPPGPRPDS